MNAAQQIKKREICRRPSLRCTVPAARRPWAGALESVRFAGRKKESCFNETCQYLRG
jgi:hypothetical protein